MFGPLPDHPLVLVLPDSSVYWWAADVCRRPSSPHQETDRLLQ